MAFLEAILVPPAAIANEGNEETDFENREKKIPFGLVRVLCAFVFFFTTIWTFQSPVEGQKDWEIPN